MALLLATACLGGRPAHAFAVAVSILPQKYFVARIAGADAQVLVMVGPGASPATYEPTARQIADLARARLYFEIGVPFERAWRARFASANPAMRLVDTTVGIARRALDPQKDLGRAHTAPDPHLWTNPALAKVMAARICAALVQLNPGHGPLYRANYRKLAGDLDALDRAIRTRLTPFRGRSFLVFHAAWGYFADAYGVHQIPIEAEGKEPGPKALSRVIEQAKALGIKVVFVQPQFSNRNARMIAAELGGKVVPLDPLAEDYFANLRHVAAAIAQAMGPP